MSPGKYRSSHVWGHVTVLITGTTMNSGLLLGTARGSCLLLSSLKNATHCLRQGLSAYGQNMGGSQCLSTFVEMPHKTVFNLLKCHDATRQQYQDFQYWWMQEVDVFKKYVALYTGGNVAKSPAAGAKIYSYLAVYTRGNPCEMSAAGENFAV